MSHVTHVARVTGPIPYVAASGRRAQIPLGPCLVEEHDGDVVDIVWGLHGERMTELPADVVAAAERAGDLVLLD